MARTGSLPYVFLLAAVSIGVAVFLWTVLDAAVAELVFTDQWGSGSEDTERAREHVLAMWDWATVLIVTSVAMTVLIASRRGR